MFGSAESALDAHIAAEIDGTVSIDAGRFERDESSVGPDLEGF